MNSLLTTSDDSEQSSQKEYLIATFHLAWGVVINHYKSMRVVNFYPLHLFGECTLMTKTSFFFGKFFLLRIKTVYIGRAIRSKVTSRLLNMAAICGVLTLYIKYPYTKLLGWYLPNKLAGGYY